MSDTEQVLSRFPKAWLKEIDKLVAANYIKNRQQFITEAVREKVLPLLQVDKKEA